tara:strand:- start:2663 stop:4273 length:1611 start_codon:yes stop_codon:yes gene_type:complete
LTNCSFIEKADKIYINGNIYTGQENDDRYNYIAIKKNIIISVGTGEYSHLVDHSTKIIDLKNNFTLPGFIDNHTHLMWGGATLRSIELKNINDKNIFINTFKNYVNKYLEDRWIEGGNWDHENWGGVLPSKSWIDSVTLNNPVLVTRIDGHMALSNSIALKKAGINRFTPNPPGGIIDKDPITGEPTGILKENAIDLVRRVIPKKTKEIRDEIFNTSMKHAASFGVTQVHDMCSWDDLLTYKRNKDKLTLRIKAYTWYENWNNLIDLIKSDGAGDDMLRWDGIKAMVDGSLGSRTAWMHNHYLDDKNTRGVLIINDTTFFKDLIKNIDNNDVQLAVHAIGDKANDWIIDHFLQIIEHNGIKDRRFRIEHAQHLTNNGIDKIIKHDIIPSMQPYGCIDDTRWMHKRISNALMARSYIFNTFIQNNVNLTFGSDWDVTPLNPLEGIYAAVSRKTLNGKHPDGWYPEQKISIYDAIKCYTKNNAYAGFQETKLGVLKKDMLADFVVLSKDITTIETSEILKVKVLRTVVGGKDVYELSD